MATAGEVRADTTALPTEPSAVAPVRDAYIDNVKALFVVLVVVAHTVGQVVVEAPGAGELYTWIFLFNMPAFVLVSGMLTSAVAISGDRARGLITSLVLPLVIFQLLYMAYFEIGGRGKPWTVDVFLTPIYQLWFLAALVLWRLAAPLLRQLRFPFPIAVVVSLAAGTATELTSFLALNRTASFLPFFVAGLLLGRAPLLRPAPKRARPVAAVVLVLSVAVAAWFHATFPLPWVYWTRTYEQLDVSTAEGSAIRMLMMLLAFVMAWAVLVIVPRRSSWFTNVGRHSMYPFLLHGFLIFAFGWSVLDSKITAAWALVCLVAVAVAVPVALASRPVRRVFRPLAEPRVPWLFKPSPIPVPSDAKTRRTGP